MADFMVGAGKVQDEPDTTFVVPESKEVLKE